MKTPEEIIHEAASEICRRIERPIETHGAALVDVISKAVGRILSISSVRPIDAKNLPLQNASTAKKP